MRQGPGTCELLKSAATDSRRLLFGRGHAVVILQQRIRQSPARLMAVIAVRAAILVQRREMPVENDWVTALGYGINSNRFGRQDINWRAIKLPGGKRPVRFL